MLPGGRPDPAHRTVQRVGVEQESADIAVPGVPVEREDAVAGGDDVRERLVPHLPDDELPGGKGQREITGGLRRGFRLAPAGYEQEALAAEIEHDLPPVEQLAAEDPVVAEGALDRHVGNDRPLDFEPGDRTPEMAVHPVAVRPADSRRISVGPAQAVDEPQGRGRIAGIGIGEMEIARRAGVEFDIHPGLPVAVAACHRQKRASAAQLHARHASAAGQPQTAHIVRDGDRRVGIGHTDGAPTQQVAPRDAVDPQAGEDQRSVGHDQHRMVAEKRVAHPQAVEPNQVDGDDMSLEIADFLGFHGLGTQFAAQRFADAGARRPGVEDKPAGARRRAEHHDIFAVLDRIGQVEPHGRTPCANLLHRKETAQDKQQALHRHTGLTKAVP